jgi:hypothetical protein
MEDGTIYGKSGKLPAGAVASLANNAMRNASLDMDVGSAKRGTAGTYTKGDVAQTGGNNIGTSDDTLIATP